MLSNVWKVARSPGLPKLLKSKKNSFDVQKKPNQTNKKTPKAKTKTKPTKTPTADFAKCVIFFIRF